MKNYTVKKYPQGTFSWADLYTKDMAASKKFLSSLFGWVAQDVPDVDYTMFMLDGESVAGASSMKGEGEIPQVWSCYITVDSVDEMAAKTEELGGKVTMPAMDVMAAGRMIAIQDPSGGDVLLWEPKDHIGATVVNKVGAMGWNELYTNDVEAAKEFYAGLFGWTYETSPDNPGYHTIVNNGRMNGGILAITPEMGEGIMPHWIPYFTIENVEESLKVAEENGGKLLNGPMEIPGIGKMAGVAGPSGAAFVLFEMAVEPDGWED